MAVAMPSTAAGSCLHLLVRISTRHFPFRRFVPQRCFHMGMAAGFPRKADSLPKKTELPGVTNVTNIKNVKNVKNVTGVKNEETVADLHMRKWQILSAVCVERSAIISAPKTPMEEEFATLLAQQEVELSLLSDHEMQKKEDAQKLKKKKDVESLADEEIIMETAQDREDNWSEQMSRFKPQNRTTEADEKEDLKSINRKLDRKLYLATHQVLGGEPQWVFPQGAWETGESLRETSGRVLRKTCGEELQVSFLGSAPCGWYKYKYPAESEIAKEFYGAKVFFFKALLDVKKTKAVMPADDIVDFRWLTREEFSKVFLEKYFERVERFLFEYNEFVPRNAENSEMLRLKF